MHSKMAKEIGLTIDQVIEAEEMSSCIESVAGHLLKYVAELRKEVASLRRALMLVGSKVNVAHDGGRYSGMSGRVVNCCPYSERVLIQFMDGDLGYVADHSRLVMEGG